MSETTDIVKSNYPLHYYVWNNNSSTLEELLQQKKYNIEELDPRGRTPLMVAVVLDHIESAGLLLRHGANASFVSKSMWSVPQEAISTGDSNLLRLVLVHRDAQVVRHQGMIVAELLKKLCETPDFYIEMKWEFTSWLPLISRMCPSDVCRIWKCGPNVRIDTNLIGFNGASSWVRGQLSYIFKVGENEAYMDEINHTERIIYRHNIPLKTNNNNRASDGGAGASAAAAAQLFVREPSDSSLACKMTQPIFVTYLDTDKIEFEKSKSGFWGWRSDRKEMINNHNCQIYCAHNVQIITLRRTEHLTEENIHDMHHRSTDEQRTDDHSNAATGSGAADILFPGAGPGNLLTNLIQAAAVTESKDKVVLDTSHEAASYNPNEITFEQYFSTGEMAKTSIDIGRPKSMTTKVKTFKARLWLCLDYPLSLHDQVVPIIDLMSEYNPYFNKLKDFLTKQLPPGFPLKVEIPLYHVLNASVSFGNLHGQDTSVFGVSTVPVTSSASTPASEGASGDLTNQPLINKSTDASHKSVVNGEQVKCVIDETIFDVGKGYQVVVENSPGHYGALDDEEHMVQMAVQRSLVEFGSADNLMKREYSLRKRSVIEARAGEYVEPEEAWLQQAIAASLSLDGAEIPVTSADEAYWKAMEESRLEQERDVAQLRREDEELRRALELSTREK